MVLGGIRDSVGDAVDDATDAAGDVADSVSDTAGDVADTVSDTVGGAIGGARDTAGDVADTVDDASDRVSDATDPTSGSDLSDTVSDVVTGGGSSGDGSTGGSSTGGSSGGSSGGGSSSGGPPTGDNSSSRGGGGGGGGGGGSSSRTRTETIRERVGGAIGGVTDRVEDVASDADDLSIDIGGSPATDPTSVDVASVGAPTLGDRVGDALGDGPDRVDPGERGTIADANVPGTDDTVQDVVDRADRGYRNTVVDTAGDIGRGAGEMSIPVGPAGGIEGSEARGQLGEDFGRSAAQAVNVPGALAGGLRLGPQAARLEGDPEGARQAAEAGVDLAREGGAFARENPGRATAIGAGALVGAGVATGATRAGSRLTGSRTTADDIVDGATEPTQPQPGTGGTGSVLEPSDVRQPASTPGASATSTDDLTTRIQRELDAFRADTRGAQQIGGQRPRPGQRPADRGGGRVDPSDDLLGGSPRDRLSDDIVARQRRDLDEAQGTFDGAGDPIMGRAPDRGTSPGSRIPRDPLDTRGGRTPTLGRTDLLGGASVTTGATLGGQLDGGDVLDGQLEQPGESVMTLDDLDIGTDTPPDVDTPPREETGGILDVGSDEDVAAMEQLRAQTAVDQAFNTDQRRAAMTPTQELLGDPDTIGDPSQASRGGGRGGGGGTPGPRPRPQPFNIDPEADDEEGLFVFGADDAVFGSGIADADDFGAQFRL